MSRSVMLSVIIPAYNVEKTIYRCIKCIFDVSYCVRQVHKLEVIIVENGSTDNTSGVVENLSVLFPQIKVLHSDKGVSKARNAGLDAAIGEYVVFVDADDYLTPDGLRSLYKSIEDKSVDLFLYGHIAGEEVRKVTDEKEPVWYTEERIESCRMIMLENPTKYMQVWAKLFKRSIIEEFNLRFNEDLRLSEDSDFTLRYTKYCNKIEFSPKIIYHYSLNSTSTMRVYDGTKVKQYVVAMKQTALSVASESENIKHAFLKYVLMHMHIAMVREIFVKSNTDTFIKKFYKMKAITKELVFSKAISGIRINECYTLRMLPIFFFKMNLNILAALIYMLRAEQNARKESRENE